MILHILPKKEKKGFSYIFFQYKSYLFHFWGYKCRQCIGGLLTNHKHLAVYYHLFFFSQRVPSAATRRKTKMFKSIVNAFTGENHSDDNKTKRIKGTVVLMKKNVLDFNDFSASFLDRVHEFLGRGVSLQLISSVHADSG